jgi:uncharacterized SAM-binding protein YcdF (DUF218 family)
VFYYASKIAWFFATPSSLLPALVAVGLALMAWRRARRLGFALAALGTLAIFVAGLSPLANWVVLPLEQRFPAYRDDGRPVTGVIVLGGALESEVADRRGQVILNEAGERLTAMADLARRYPDARIVFTGGGSTILRDELSEAVALQRFAGSLGIAPERILFETESRTTAENASLTRRLVEPKPGERWLLVTSAFHMPRSIGCFRQAGFEVTAYPVDFRTRGPEDRWKPFSFVSEGLRRLDLASKEWAGLVAYRLFGQTSALFPAP